MVRLFGRLPSQRRMLLGVVVALFGTVAAALGMLPFRDVLATDAVGLVFVVPIVVGTAIGGTVGAVAGVTAGFVAFNVWFTEPYQTLLVHDLNDVIGLIVFVLVGAISSVTVALQHRAEAEARRRASEAQILFDLSRLLISPGELKDGLQAVVGRLQEVFELETAVVLLPVGVDQWEVAAESGAPLSPGVMEGLPRPAAVGPMSEVEVIPLQADGVAVGVLVVEGHIGRDDQRVLEVCANQAASAVQRARLAEQATRAQVLERGDELRAALMRSVSHDLRTPLAAITAAAEDLVDEDVDFSEADRRLLAQTVAEEATRLDRLVANLLDMSRVEAGGLSVRREAVELEELAAAAADRCRADLRIETVGTAVGLVDPLLIGQVLDNLVENALTYGRGAVDPSIQLEGLGARVVVSVVDHGPGVPPPEREAVFDLFHRLAPEGPAPRGTGLGLAICQGYVEAHGGKIWVEETPGGGATFRFSVPRASDLPSETDVHEFVRVE